MDYIILCLDQNLDQKEKSELEDYTKDIKKNSKYIRKKFQEYLFLRKSEKVNSDKVKELKDIIDNMTRDTPDDKFEPLKTQYETIFKTLCEESGTNLLNQIQNGVKLSSTKKKDGYSIKSKPEVSELDKSVIKRIGSRREAISGSENDSKSDSDSEWDI